tara:strand:+ start:62047 stop:62292 length:246 start_codon:yes stop_codon:yes gene_type:complete
MNQHDLKPRHDTTTLKALAPWQRMPDGSYESKRRPTYTIIQSPRGWQVFYCDSVASFEHFATLAEAKQRLERRNSRHHSNR